MNARRLFAAGLVLLLVPSLLDAQRRRRGDPANWDQITKQDAEPTVLSLKEVEAMDPVRLLVAKRKDLKLTEDQFAQLKAMEAKGKARDAELLATMDSLRKEMKPQGAMDDMQRLRLQVVRRSFAETFAKIRANYDAAAAEALPVCDESQRAAAEALLAKQKAEAEEVIEEKLGSARGPRGPAAGPGGGPPRRP